MKPNLIQDIANAEWILNKIRANDNYAQNLYAAMCNNQFQKREVMPILSDDIWSCSWRSAGGYVAELQDKGGDYMDWYCSGVSADEIDGIEGYVAEAIVTDEIREDLLKLNWIVFPWSLGE